MTLIGLAVFNEKISNDATDACGRHYSQNNDQRFHLTRSSPPYFYLIRSGRQFALTVIFGQYGATAIACLTSGFCIRRILIIAFAKCEPVALIYFRRLKILSG